MLKKIKKITIIEVLGCFKFILVFFPAFIYHVFLKCTHKELWLICETASRSRDNGVVFYEYMKREHPEVKCFYAIDKYCPDYQRIKKLGNIIQWSSIKHYFYYLSATKNISSHKEGNPNQALFTFLHLYLNLYNNRVFLQHGITKDNLPMFYYKNTKFKTFICGAKPEFNYVNDIFGYPKESVKYTGLARFDNLHNTKCNKNIILFIPTWRRWIENKQDFLDSNYYQEMIKFLNSKDLEQILTRNKKILYFYPHEKTQKFLQEIKIRNKCVKIKSIENCNIQQLLIKGSLLITDYSSLYFDFAYMKKPILYYQYDQKEYREKHMQEGYFNYNRDGFGKVCTEHKELIKELEKLIKNNLIMEDKYLLKAKKFFELNDDKNCERIFEVIMER